MKEIAFDTEARDCIMSNGDFTTTSNPSVQNGVLLLQSRATNILNLILGIGINQVRGGSVAQAVYELNRWVQQVQQDGGQASYTAKSNGPDDIDLSLFCNYL
jgi:hypothetical protein